MKSTKKRVNFFPGCRHSALWLGTGALFLLGGTRAQAQFSLTNTTYTQNFDALGATGTSTSTLDSGTTWYVGTGTAAIT